MAIDKAALLARRLPERDVPIPGLGSVLVRALSRAEAAPVGGIADNQDREAFIISVGLVDPVMTVDEVKEWMAAAPAGELEPVSTAIGELSGLLPASATDAYKSDGSESGS